MALTVLSVGFPLAPVAPDSAGGSEQVLGAIDRALVAAGHRSIVIACKGSEVAGTLVEVPLAAGLLDEAARRSGEAHFRDAIAAARSRWDIDLVHLHGFDFDAFMPEPGVPVLVTLHVPLGWYAPGVLRQSRPDTWMHCVSPVQHEEFSHVADLLAPIENGVPVERLRARHAKRRYALMLGRISPDKGVAIAIDAAKLAGIALIVAGELFPYVDHLRYFEEEIRPRLDRQRKLIGRVGFARKRRLLTAAHCLLVPSLAPETSSLVAREAIACGTPVVAFPSGALAQTVESGRTGFLVDDVAGMAQAIDACCAIDAETCRAVARARFSQERMLAAYLALYERLARRPSRARRAGAMT